MNIPFCIIGIGKNISASFVTPEVALHLLTIYPVPWLSYLFENGYPIYFIWTS